MSTKPSKGIMSEEHKEKIRLANKGKHHSPNSEFKIGHAANPLSIEKMRLSNLGRIPWNKGTTGVMKSWAKGKKFSQEYRDKLSKAHIGIHAGEKHPLWSGDFPSYAAVHAWVRSNKLKPIHCSDCGREASGKSLHWSNVDHSYRRNLDDYTARCSSCHKVYDLFKGLSKH